MAGSVLDPGVDEPPPSSPGVECTLVEYDDWSVATRLEYAKRQHLASKVRDLPSAGKLPSRCSLLTWSWLGQVKHEPANCKIQTEAADKENSPPAAPASDVSDALSDEP